MCGSITWGRDFMVTRLNQYRFYYCKWNKTYLHLQILSVEAEKMRVVLEKYYYNNELRLLTVPNKTLKSEGFLRSNKVKKLRTKQPMRNYSENIQYKCMKYIPTNYHLLFCVSYSCSKILLNFVGVHRMLWNGRRCSGALDTIKFLQNSWSLREYN